MDAARDEGICRRFLNGTCRFGSRCIYRHDCIPPVQICRYFQKGICWYGERCRYVHVLHPEVDAAVAPRRGSMPTVSSSRGSYAPPDRRGSEPALLHATVTSSRRSQLLVHRSYPPQNNERVAADIAEEQSQDARTPLSASWESIQSSEDAQACNERNEQEISSNEAAVNGAAAAAAAAASNSLRIIEAIEASLQSKSVTCGICMDKVYEKPDPRTHVFGILPNCNHPFCLQCIMTWRKTKDFGPDVVKSCPQCRVRSAFYVPHRHWVEGRAKEGVIAAFKEKFSKKRCSYFSRYGCCPFKTECLYRHDKHAHGSFPYYTEEDDYDSVDLLNLFIAMTLLGDDDEEDDEDDFGFPFYLSEEYGF
ncbi:hypothetical protein CgunFtcFv8_000557 [Champsocephalus gunnari]|uniref:RING-type E3 ubiquitin transferase n=1 Tax=Champsocephalus gunnari TaxID=52237 RepID=A0AAN8HPG0_CHAGU|nr:hypothetical protein CgunFtcFv8_000557 [Champsocephalus gunnari]